jgi:hypothetical protein
VSKEWACTRPPTLGAAERIMIRLRLQILFPDARMPHVDYLELLNAEQRSAVVHGVAGYGANIAGPLLVIAGAARARPTRSPTASLILLSTVLIPAASCC